MSDTTPSTPSSSGSKLKVDSLFREGDMTLVSSDNIRFRLPSFYLLAASGVFRDMYSVGRGDDSEEIKFTDSAIEYGWAVRAWLQVITDQIPTHRDIYDIAKAVLLLAKKYDCRQAAFTVLALCHREFDKGDIGIGMAVPFFAAADFGDPELLAKLVRRGDIRFNKDLPDGTDANPQELLWIPSGKVTDPAAWELSKFRQIPHDHIWALLRARATAETHNDRADKLLSLLSLIGETASPARRKRKADEVEA